MIITGKKFSKPALSRVINGDTQLATPDAAPAKIRLDHLLVQQHPEYNRSSLQTFIKSGFVTVDGQVITKSNAKVREGATLTLALPPSATPPERPPVLYEDDHVLGRKAQAFRRAAQRGVGYRACVLLCWLKLCIAGSRRGAVYFDTRTYTGICAYNAYRAVLRRSFRKKRA